MSGSPVWLLQQAIFTRLNDDATLTTTLGAEVYDGVPKGAAYPYVVVGEVTEMPDDTHGKTGRDLTFTVHYWSQVKGMEQVHEIHNRVDALLDRWKPAVTGWDTVEMQHEFYDTLRDPDGVTRHGVSRYRIFTRQQ